MNIQTWTVTINGNEHHIRFELHPWLRSRHMIEIDEYRFPAYSNLMGYIYDLDLPLTIEDKEIRVVYLGAKADIVMDGVYIDSGKKYRPLFAAKLIKHCSSAFLIAGLILQFLTSDKIWYILLLIGLLLEISIEVISVKAKLIYAALISAFLILTILLP